MQISKKATRAVERRATKLSPKKMTDQSFKKSCDINNIVKQIIKTGRVPESTKIAHYADFSALPTLEDAFTASLEAQDAFYSIPATVRKLMDNDPSKLEEFVKNEANREICYSHGLIDRPAKENVPKTDEQGLVIKPAKKETRNEGTQSTEPASNT